MRILHKLNNLSKMANTNTSVRNKWANTHIHHPSDIYKLETVQSTKKEMASANTHRKNRNSRDKQSQLPDICFTSISGNSSSTSSSPSSSASLHHRPRLSLNRLKHGTMLILVLTLLNATKFGYAKTQNSHSTIATMAALMASTTALSIAAEASTMSASSVSKYSQPLTAASMGDDSFHPIIPKDLTLESISQNVFTKNGQYRVFEGADSDLRATLGVNRPTYIEMDTHRSPGSHSISSNKQSEVVTLQTKQKSLLMGVSDDASLQPHLKQRKQQMITGNKVRSLSEEMPKAMELSKENKVDSDTQNSQRRLNDGTKEKRELANSKGPLVNNTNPQTSTGGSQESLAIEVKGLENLLAEYVDNFFNQGQYQPKPELIMALQQNATDMRETYERQIGKYVPNVEAVDRRRPIRQAVTKHANGELRVNIPRAFETGRLLFFAGLKKVMWPIYMGLQILKSLMFALLLPTLIGSFGKLLGKGISSGSAPLFIRPMDEPQDLDFRDNNFNFEDDSNKFSLMDDAANGGNTKDGGYAYNQAEASQTHNQYAYNAASINQQALSRYGMNERQQLMQDSYLSALQSLGAASFKNSNGISGSSSGNLGGGGNGGLAGLATTAIRQKPVSPANMNTFQQFQKVPASSLLLSNYDPFYSPLLSRLDSVFAQLKLNSDDEACREKLICLMYANPAKYAPYSNLVSAQLSRELNELRKPTSDNPDILRFFKYMRAAKDGQDGIDCEKSFDKCKEFKDFENPAMVSTYHDINKLVQARKFT